MKHHPAWLAAGLLVFVILACNLGKKANSNNGNGNTNSNNSNSQASADADVGSGLAIKEIHMAKDDGNGSPGEATDTFEPGDRTIHCVITLKSPKVGTQIKFSWWIVAAEGAQNEHIKDGDYKTRARDDLVHGHLTVPEDWPAGKYKVQVYVNGDIDKTAFYTVR